MAIIRDAIVFLVISCIAATVVGQNYDGLPRPTNFPDAPTTSYGPEPKMMYEGGPLDVDCTWYGFANELYDASIGEMCLEDLRAEVLNATAVAFEPFVYYVHHGPTGMDPATEEFFCSQGCFNLDGGALPPDSGAFPPSYSDAPAPAPDSHLRGPSLAPFFWPGAPPEADLAPPAVDAPPIAPPPTSGD